MSSFSIKLLACFTMLIDHIGYCLYPNILLRMIGRLSFPLFAFQIAIGYSHTKNKAKYITRMLIFAVLSQLPFLFFSNFSFGTNIGFSFFISLLCLYIIDLSKEKNNFAILALIFPLILSTILLKADYSFLAPLCVIIFYQFYAKNKNWPLLIGTFFITIVIYIKVLNIASFQIFSMLALLILPFYNGKKGKDIKYFFYIFYPLHMIILRIIYNIII